MLISFQKIAKIEENKSRDMINNISLKRGRHYFFNCSFLSILVTSLQTAMLLIFANRSQICSSGCEQRLT